MLNWVPTKADFAQMSEVNAEVLDVDVGLGAARGIVVCVVVS